MQLLRIDILHISYCVVAGFLDDRHPVFCNTQFHVFGGRVFLDYFLRTHLREEQYFLNGGLSCHQHHQTVDTDTDAGCRRHTILQSTQEILVDNHCLVVSLVGKTHLFFEAFFLIQRIVQLRVGIGQFLAVHHQFETFGQSRFGTVHLRQR